MPSDGRKAWGCRRLGAKRPPLFKSNVGVFSDMHLSDEGTYICKAFSPRCYVIQKVFSAAIYRCCYDFSSLNVLG